MAGWGADNVIISSILGVTQVAIFAIVQRLFQFVVQPFSLINGPLWGAYADADARGDKAFIRKTLKRSLTLTFFGTVILAVILLMLHGWIIKKWTHDEIIVPYELIIACGVWTVLEATGNAFAMFLNGTGIVKRQMIVVCTFIALVLPLKFVLTNFLGLIGIPIATVLVYVITNAYFYGYLFFPDIKEKIRSSPQLQA
jgi:O-antigen/teichoic acid export membrane protein